MRFHRPTVTVIGCVAAAMSVLAASPAGATPSRTSLVPTPRSSHHFGAAIEGFSPYQPEKFCRHRVEPGVKRFEHLLTSTYAGTAIVSDLRPCAGGTSEHYDGRAVDWGVDYRNPAQRAQGKAMLRWLFTRDPYGNRDAMFRRLGLMYVIWDHRIWGSWDQRWDHYSCKGVTACHVDHMHFSFGWAGAEAKTSYFSGRISPTVGYPRHRRTHRHA